MCDIAVYKVQNKNAKLLSVSNQPLKIEVVYSVNENVKPVSNLTLTVSEVSIHTAGRVYRFSRYMHTANYLT